MASGLVSLAAVAAAAFGASSVPAAVPGSGAGSSAALDTVTPGLAAFSAITAAAGSFAALVSVTFGLAALAALAAALDQLGGGGEALDEVHRHLDRQRSCARRLDWTSGLGSLSIVHSKR